MSVANARVLIEYSAPYSSLQFADSYVREFARGGQRKGYSSRFHVLWRQVRSGSELLAKIDPRSNRNGAAMRATVIGVLKTVQEVLRVAEVQARISHNTPEGIFSARVVALLSHFALYENAALEEGHTYCLDNLPREDVAQFGYTLSQSRPARPIKAYEHQGISVAIETVHAVVMLMRTSRSLLDMLRQIIRWGGDTDTVAAIAWGIASTRLQDEQLPAFLEQELEGGNAQTGPAYLRQIGYELMAKFA
ncbi:hypothetical protein A3H75_00350 [Candidatus Uhrbacteria bacterium RIFCSPLOWO2_02_FULL_51_9]|uniref:ADP-ribosylglycohydrolase n=1 Tax=Candidatus Uhrbacteria bacterium RIFCSPLOWO2_02_FULL_51_9 TaxID=1802410 RepID=A0A1F7VDR6_9BACT|nr:MAG: hypothetical protein A3H75_00350 [Candidatus Uhrbacteria bacterium RIFCSPLOWO2_02_FULL_51_9]